MKKPHISLVPPRAEPPPLRLVRDEDAEARVSVAYICDRRVEKLLQSNPGRVVNLTRDGAASRHVTAAYVLAALIARDRIGAELRDDGPNTIIAARRARGLHDLCEEPGCGRPLGMIGAGPSRRDAKPHPWRCLSCTGRARKVAPVCATCEQPGCEKPLGAGATERYVRKTKPHPWLCRSCGVSVSRSLTPGGETPRVRALAGKLGPDRCEAPAAAGITADQAQEVLRRLRSGERTLSVARALGINRYAVRRIRDRGRNAT